MDATSSMSVLDVLERSAEEPLVLLTVEEAAVEVPVRALRSACLCSGMASRGVLVTS